MEGELYLGVPNKRPFYTPIALKFGEKKNCVSKIVKFGFQFTWYGIL